MALNLLTHLQAQLKYGHFRACRRCFQRAHIGGYIECCYIEICAKCIDIQYVKYCILTFEYAIKALFLHYNNAIKYTSYGQTHNNNRVDRRSVEICQENVLCGDVRTKEC